LEDTGCDPRHNRKKSEYGNDGVSENLKMMGDALPLITAVIPTRGRPDLVVLAVRSALNQTYPNIEVVVVVDGPDAATVDTLEKLAEPRLRVIALAENVGGSEARNIGARAARGNWVAMLDDDDEWFPEKLTKQLAALANVTARHCLVTCRCLKRQPGHVDILAPRRFPREGENISEYMFYSDEDKLRHTCGPQTSGYLATRDLFLDVPFTKGLKCHQDWDWYLRAMNNATTVSAALDEPLYILNVEPARPRVTQQQRWEYSLSWVESRKSLFTPRAYTSFLINECMYRCEETKDRVRIFRKLLGLCRRGGGLRTRDLPIALKWYLFRPTTRLRLISYYKRLNTRAEQADGPHAIETPPTKQEVHS
jgi:glycosyltransferase involved in cell wall biosynthesis